MVNCIDFKTFKEVFCFFEECFCFFLFCFFFFFRGFWKMMIPALDRKISLFFHVFPYFLFVLSQNVEILLKLDRAYRVYRLGLPH